MSNDVSIYAPRDLAQSQQVAETLAHSGLVPDALRGKPAAVWAILALGAELGLPGPMAALSGIHVISGRPSPSPQTMLALCLRHPSCEFFTFLSDKSDDTAATWVAKRRGSDPVPMTFSIEEAKRLGYTSKDQWRKQPNVMLRWRAMAALARLVFPDVTMGLYTTDEVRDFAEPESTPAPVSRRNATPAETASRRVGMLRSGTSAPPAAVEDAEVVAPARPGREMLAEALAAAGISADDFDRFAAANGARIIATMAHADAAKAAEWLAGKGGPRVRAWLATPPPPAASAAPGPLAPDAPSADEVQAALEEKGVPAELADAWARHKGIKPATDAGARALWLSIMHPATAEDNDEWGAFVTEWDRTHPDDTAPSDDGDTPNW